MKIRKMDIPKNNQPRANKSKKDKTVRAKNHNLSLTRFQHGEDFTHGILKVDGVFECFTVEDQKQLTKVYGETRIPEGSYEVKFKKVNTPLTKKYQVKFDWFTYHLEIVGVEGFTNIYFHIGNTEGDTSGCILVGQTCQTQRDKGFIGRSTQAFTAFYALLSGYLNKGEKITLTIK